MKFKNPMDPCSGWEVLRVLLSGLEMCLLSRLPAGVAGERRRKARRLRHLLEVRDEATALPVRD